MRNPVNIDYEDNRALRREIGERLQVYLRIEPKLPANLRMQVDRLRELEGLSPPIAPDVEQEFESRPTKNINRGDQPRFNWSWRRGG